MINIDFAKMGGLIPAIIQDHASGDVLMVAFMDEKTLNLTLETGKTWFFSRTRNTTTEIRGKTLFRVSSLTVL